jgi:hypothetical protein
MDVKYSPSFIILLKNLPYFVTSRGDLVTYNSHFLTGPPGRGPCFIDALLKIKTVCTMKAIGSASVE